MTNTYPSTNRLTDRIEFRDILRTANELRDRHGYPEDIPELAEDVRSSLNAIESLVGCCHVDNVDEFDALFTELDELSCQASDLSQRFEDAPRYRDADCGDYCLKDHRLESSFDTERDALLTKLEAVCPLPQSRFAAATDKLSRAASAIVKHIDGSAFAHDDVILWHAPSECHDLVSKFNRSQWEQTLAALGYESTAPLLNEFVGKVRAYTLYEWAVCVEF